MATIATPSHIPPILPTHLKQRIRDLPPRTYARGIHHYLEHVEVFNHRLLQALERAMFFFVGRARQFQLVLHRFTMRVAERVGGDDRQLAGMF